MDFPKSSDFCGACEAAAKRVYRELRDLGFDDGSAFRSAVRVLELRHPGRTRQDCADAAARWLCDDPQDGAQLN